MLLEKEKRTAKPLIIIIPKDSTIPFQMRMTKIFSGSIEGILPDDEFFYRLLTIEVGESVRTVIQIKVIDNGEEILLESGYSLLAEKNDHFAFGSVSYKLKFSVTKLNVEKAKSLGIPFNKTLKQIEKSKTQFKIGSRKISRSDIFYENKTILCYSGDTHVDSDLFEFFSNCQILIHESTYLTQEEEYHLDSHSDIISLIEEADKVSGLRILIPIHFSIRYTEAEISNCIANISKKSYQVINPINTLLVQIDQNGSVITLP
jgi:ribonuclease BN (tRNA processing enzyme)